MGKVLCLMYHRVNPYRNDPYNITVSCENFKAQLEWLSRNYTIVRFEDDWEKIEADKPAVCLTFDDGYEDFALYSVPMLTEAGIPATVFACTGYIENRRELWYDELVSYCTRGVNYPKEFHLEDSIYEQTWETDTPEKRLELAKTLRWLLRMEDDWKRFDSFIRQLKEFSGLDKIRGSKNYLMDLSQLKDVSNNPLITVGAHTKYHISLGTMGPDEQRKTIEDSINYLSVVTGKKIDVFAYPFGMNMDFNLDTIRILKEVGIKKAPSTTGVIWKPGCDPYKIPRFGVRNWNLDEFKNKLDKFWMEDI